MAVVRQWKTGSVIFEAPYFDDLLVRNGGFLPEDLPCHALWHYYCIAMRSQEKEKNQLVYEGDTDPDFKAEKTFMAIANTHGCSPDEMLRYWDAVELQATMMGGDKAALAPKYKFNKKSVN